MPIPGRGMPMPNAGMPMPTCLMPTTGMPIPPGGICLCLTYLPMPAARYNPDVKKGN